jgi:hypothetical protein
MTSVFFSQMLADLFADSRRNKDYTLMFCGNQREIFIKHTNQEAKII